jgi:hypothetical protein
LCGRNYGWALFGQILLSSSSSIANPGPNKIANTWFHARERFLVVCLGSFASSLGTGIGYIFSPLIAGGNDEVFLVFCFVFELIRISRRK